MGLYLLVELLLLRSGLPGMEQVFLIPTVTVVVISVIWAVVKAFWKMPGLGVILGLILAICIHPSTKHAWAFLQNPKTIYNGSEQKPRPTPYDFPHHSVIGNYEIDCKEDAIDDIFEAADGIIGIARGALAPDVTTEEELEFGESMHAKFKNNYVRGDSRSRKLKGILKKMVPHVHRTELNYEIHLVDSKEVNAWTIPGGKIYFTTSMYEFCQNDDELAIIIGHEVAHGENLHTREIVEDYKTAKLIGAGGGFEDLSLALYRKLAKPFSKVKEFEADFGGFYLASMAGFDPGVGVEIWNRLAEGRVKNDLAKILSSHPHPEIRYQCGRNHIEECKKSPDKPKRENPEDGL